MQIRQIRQVACNLGIHAANLDQLALIGANQLFAANFDCFATAYDGLCGRTNCAWRDDCFALAERGCRHAS